MPTAQRPPGQGSPTNCTCPVVWGTTCSPFTSMLVEDWAAMSWQVERRPVKCSEKGAALASGSCPWASSAPWGTMQNGAAPSGASGGSVATKPFSSLKLVQPGWARMLSQVLSQAWSKNVGDVGAQSHKGLLPR